MTSRDWAAQEAKSRWGSRSGVLDALRDLASLTVLASVGDILYINDNACLSQAEAEAFASAIEVGDTAEVADNEASYPCY